MKSLQRTFTLLSLAVLLFTGATRAQTTAPFMRVNVPFDFQFGNKILPAGYYVIGRSGAYMLTLRDSHNRVVAIAVTTPSQALSAPPTPKLVFRLEDGREVLTQVWTSGSRYGYEFPAARNSTAFAKASTPVQTAAGR